MYPIYLEIKSMNINIKLSQYGNICKKNSKYLNPFIDSTIKKIDNDNTSKKEIHLVKGGLVYMIRHYFNLNKSYISVIPEKVYYKILSENKYKQSEISEDQNISTELNKSGDYDKFLKVINEKLSYNISSKKVILSV